jgi:hypothetical protein
MNTQEALSVLRALANGTDPQGNKIDESSACRQPQVVKALNRAISALVREEERERSRPANAFRPWTRREDALVCEAIRKGTDLNQIARAHNRTVPSIVARLLKLGELRPGKAA